MVNNANKLPLNISNDQFWRKITKSSFITSVIREDFMVMDNVYVKAKEVNNFIESISTDLKLNHLGISSKNTKISKAYEFGYIIINSLDYHILLNKIDDVSWMICVVATPTNISHINRCITPYVGYDTRKEDYEINIYNYYYNDQNKIKTGEVSKWASDFNYIDNNLYPKINVEMMLKSYITSDENILILAGEPGTGKTTMIKKIMQALTSELEYSINIGYVKDKDILEDNEFWVQCASHQWDILVFDDLDDSLLPRGSCESDFVSNLLSFSDGIFDSDTKIIISTNHNINDVDSAIVRPGRCWDILNMPTLTYEEGRIVWVESFKLSIESFDEIFPKSKNITQAYIYSEFQRIKSNLPKEYLLDQSISIRNEFMK